MRRRAKPEIYTAMKTTALVSALGFLVYGLVVFALFFGARRPALSSGPATPVWRSVTR